MRRATVRTVRPDQLIWEFRSSAPKFSGPGFTVTDLDPFPAYPHDAAVVRAQARAVMEQWPAETPVTFWLLPVEMKERVNAQQHGRYDYHSGSGRYPILHGHVVVSAKRMPPHPAMTRYLVAHEYGHVVEDWLEKRLEVKQNGIRNEYARLRGLGMSEDSYGGQWHRAAGEVMACDFRIVVAGVETEFWPHPGVPRPGKKVETWWREHAA